MKKRSLTRAFSAAVATVLIGSGLLVGAAATANAEPTPPQDRDVVQCLLSLDLANCLTGDSDLLGTGVVGEPLTLVEPVFGLLSGDLLGLLDTDITWLCDGIEIPGTAGLTELVPTEALEGCDVTVRTVTTLINFLPLTLVTDLIGITGDGEEPVEQLTAQVLPKISGANRVGGILSIDPGTWLGGTELVTPLFDYQWYNAAGPIPGAVGATYVPKLADAGGPLAATVTATLAPFLDGLGITNKVKVAKAKSKTKLSKAAGGKRVSFKVGPRAAHPTGKVKLMKGAKLLKVYKLRAADNGKRIVRLPKLSKGVHKIRAVYKGNKALKGSKSKVLRVVLR